MLTTRRRVVFALLGLSGILLASLVAGIMVGPADVRFQDVWGSVSWHVSLPGAGTPPTPLLDAIIWDLRLPRVLTAAFVGAGLAVSGAVMQSLTRNPLADPYLLGLSSGASLGAVIVLVLGVTGGVSLGLGLPIAAFAGALLALLAALTIARIGGTITPARMVLGGIAVSQFFAALTSFTIFITATGDSYREILSWLLGSLAGATWLSVTIAGVAVALVLPLLLLAGPRLDAFVFGDTAAAALGIRVNATRWTLLILVALLTGAMVSVSGAIGFIGLIIPHLMRPLTTVSHRGLLAASAISGAILLLWADTLARTVFDPRELPVGVVTAVIGVPLFVVVLRRSRGREWM